MTDTTMPFIELPSVLDVMFPLKVKDINENWDSFYTSDVFPYDIRVIKDADGNTLKTELIFAVAGVNKEDINIKVEYDQITINIDQAAKEDGNIEYIRRGLSHRSMTKSFRIKNVDIGRISSKLVDGLLIITFPTEPQARKKMFKVNIE